MSIAAYSDGLPKKVIYPYFVVDHEADAVYLYPTDGPDRVAHTEPITEHINVDYDKDGVLIGIEFLSLKIDFGEEFKLRKRAE